jgi:xanthine dehydrogenase small subunit
MTRYNPPLRMRDFLIIYVNGVRHEIGGQRAFQTLSAFLRYDLCLTGTKVVCAEGDCGSCTVLVSRGNGYQPITSCIQFLYQLDAAQVVTVEGLKHDGKLNAVQDAMVKCHGAQCGFCTPGFVVSMCSHLAENEHVDEQSLRAALVGNLCRCTGYDSIIKAGLAAGRFELRTPDVAELNGRAKEPVLITTDTRKFFKPVTVAQATRFRADNPGCVIIAGATDLGVQINKQVHDPAVVMHIGAIEELKAINVADGVLTVGALATLTDCQHACESSNQELAKMFWRHGSPLIRNAGTLAGNLANGSPIGDTMPALFVLNADIELTGRNGARRVNMNDFYTGYRKSVLAADEIITRVFIPLPKADEVLRLYKISKRHDLDISTFTAAFWMQRSNGVIGDLRIAYGGCGPMIIRLKKTEQALIGKPFNEAEIDAAAADLARSEITPISDVRGSADYRFLLAENLLRKFYFDASGVELTYDRVTLPSEGLR